MGNLGCPNNEELRYVDSKMPKYIYKEGLSCIVSSDWAKHDAFPPGNETYYKKHQVPPSELKAIVDRLFNESGSGHQTKQGDSAGGGQDANIQPAVKAADTIARLPTLLKSWEDHGTLCGGSVGAFVSITPKREDRGHTDSVVEHNLRTIGAPRREKVIEPALFGAGYFFASGTDPITCVFAYLTGSDFLISDIRTIINPDTDLQKTHVPQRSVTNGSRLDDDHFHVGAARKMSLSAEVRMCAEYNIKEKRRLKSVADEHAELLKVREKEIENLKAQLSLKEAEAAEAIHLRAQASELETVERSLRDETNALKERNAILEKEWDALDVKVTELETSAAGKERELTDLNALVTSVKSQNDNLVDRVRAFTLRVFFYTFLFCLLICMFSPNRRFISWRFLLPDSKKKITMYENCMEQLEKFQDDQIKIINDKFDNLHTDFVDMTLHLEERFYPYLLTTISGRRWLLTHDIELAIAKCLNSPDYLYAFGATIGKALEEGMQDGLAAGITHGKEGRVLTDVAAHNPSAEADYISTLRQLQNVNFPLLAELKSNKDASVEAIMWMTKPLRNADDQAVAELNFPSRPYADDQAVAGEDAASFPNVDDAELRIPQ
nr:hypothetical protein [Tanacetum cinerariifolium]